MIEVVGTYILFLATYPVAIATYAAEAPGQFGGWFAVGLSVLLLLWWWRAQTVKLWLAFWFMPGTIICGAGANGITRVQLEVRPDNVAAIGLYQSFGFVQEAVLRRAMRLDGKYYDAVQMSLIYEQEV